MLENLTKGKRSNVKVVFLKGLKEKSLGAINKNSDAVFLIETRFGIHTFFMYHLLDIVVLDRKGKIVKVRESLKPNRLFFWNPRYSYIIEAPAGLIKELELDLGNILRFSL